MSEIIINATIPSIAPKTENWKNWDGKLWVVTSPMYVSILYKDKYYNLCINPGFDTDGGSIPRVFWRVAGHPLGEWLLAYLVHDALYSAEYVERSLADDIFLELLVELGAPWTIRNAAWAAVRVGGASVWRAHTPEQIANDRKLIHLEIHPY